MWADRSREENTNGRGVEAVKDSEAYVSRIDGSYVYTRGNQYHQTALYPNPQELQLAAATAALNDTSSPALSVLILQGFDHTARSLILNFGALYFQVTIFAYFACYSLLKIKDAAFIFDTHIDPDLHTRSMGILS